jgi:hypothetical protein
MITISEIANTDTRLSGNKIRVKATTSGIPEGATEYKILLKIISIDGLLVGSPFVDPIAPDADGVAEFDISGYVDQPVDKDFQWPIPTLYEGRWHGYQNQVYDVQLVAGERYIDTNGDLQESYQAAFGTIFIVKGKLNHLVLAQLNDASTDWFGYFITGGRWLTYMPTTQYIHPEQPVKLWWKPPTTGLSFEIKAKAYYSDASEKTWIGSPVMWYDVMFEFDLQPDGLGFPPIDGVNKLLYYEVWMEGTPNVEKRTFIIDWDPHETNHYLFIDNQIGGIDTVWLSGSVKYAPKGERNIVVKPFESGMGVKQRTHYVGSSNRKRKWIINSGHKFKPELEALDILLEVRTAWLAIPPASGSTNISLYTIVPVIINSSELDLTNSMNDIESVDIELIEAY